MTPHDDGAAVTTTRPALPVEHEELLATLATHRELLRHTVRGLSEEQLRVRPTASALCLGGILKHVVAQEAQWVRFVVEGPSVMAFDPEKIAAHAAQFEPQPDETLDVLLARYEEVAARTAEVIAGQPDLSASQPLPEAPWFEPGARWSVRRVLVHVIAETAQHAGHADIIRESIDGQKTMG